ncbi:retinol dehydrogenase 16-like [Haliotis rufescens]|uniref:retinol dehydrogenase 16-like n=1 Tax=Haliotis rufescens TaxID=6454 RepID=UPI00201ECD82|nr:retinol dehydrogenase 16-like [Haliotis rufescens]
MTRYAGMLGLHFIQPLFCVSVFCLLYVSTFGLILPSFLLTGIISICYWVIRNAGTRKRIDTQGKYILITGCDTGFGNSLARLLDSKGLKVFATCLSEQSEGAKLLRENGSKQMRVLQLDVSSDASVDACLDKIKPICLDGLWTLVNNAGIMGKGDVEIQSMDTYKRIAEVNLFGVVRMCKAFLPLVRQCKGRVINVTSVRGLQAFCADSGYVMSKFALEGFTDCLRLEMRRFGVKVIHVEPGMFGLNTGIFNDENVERYKDLNKKLIDNVGDEIRAAYGQEYLDTYMRLPKMRPGSSDKDLKAVLDAFEDAILSHRPDSRYLVDGKRFDGDCMMARLRNILPVFIMDPLYFYLRPLPKEAFYSCTTSGQRRN